MVFHTDGDGDGDGFTAVWSENCGGEFVATSKDQFISSPRYPDPYPRNLFCNYSITAKPGESVNIKFLTFDLEATNNLCIFDNVTLYKSAMYMPGVMEEIGTYCFNNSISTFRAANRIDVIFRTDSFIERRGFRFQYRTDNCGGNITQPTQITTANNENGETYLPESTCVWFITAPSDKRVVVRFGLFDLEFTYGCSVDHVDIFEGHSTIESQRKSRLCGNLTRHAPSISINSNQAVVTFSSDSTVNEKGFTAYVLFMKNCNERIDLNANHRTHLLDKLSAQYEPLLDCEYFVSAPEGYVIQARFNQLHLMPCETNTTDNCSCDYVNVRDGAGPFSESFGTFCGHTTPPTLLSSTNAMFLRFVTDNFNSSTGFSVEFEMIESPCGPSFHYLNASRKSVTLQAPMNGNHYRPNMNCIWTITTDDDKYIEAHFEQLDLENATNNQCAADFVEITDEEVNIW